MNKKADIKEILEFVKSSPVKTNCIPMGYSAGYPSFHEINSQLCVTVPFLKYKITGEVDKTLVYPIRYTITVRVSDKSFVKFEDLTGNPAFRKVEFNKPIGFFRHEAIKQFNKSKYEKEKEKLFGYYNKILDNQINGFDGSGADEKSFKEHLSILLEPSVKIIYKVVDSDFYDKYLA